PEVQQEIQTVRKEAGMPPLVTPTSQIIGSQAVMNVLTGRYQTVSNQFRDLLFGLYGKTPAAIDPRVREMALRGSGQGIWITDRPANHLKPEMESARQKLGALAKTEEDVLTYVLYHTSGKQFLKQKYGLEPAPGSARPGDAR
ncbi:MAG TPA: hypothetical protein VFG28_03860, partial [Syntrophales bacterium]|nr:hypothetical protein [Syntrophales bacterium]